MGNLFFREAAWKQYLEWQAEDKKIQQRINSLLKETDRTPFTGTGKPEPLRGSMRGFWSRRITDKDRLVYRVTDGTLEIVSCKGHYED